jgi:hypothetical protein
MIDLFIRSDRSQTLRQHRPLTVLARFAHRVTAWPWLTTTLVGLAVLSSLLLPLNLLSTQRFHHDEALYATWALEIASGRNPLLQQTPIDKPPLFLYIVAGAMWLLGATETAARLPSLLATGATVGLTFGLGRKLYGPGVGLLACWLAALSPFTILFAPTAFTDPLLVALVLAACLTAAYGRAGWAGVGLGLAIAAKQQGVFFIPLVLGILACLRATGRSPDEDLSRSFPGPGCPVSPPRFGSERLSRLTWAIARPLPDVAWLLAGLTLALLPAFIWDLWRFQAPGFWRQSLINYGQLAANAASFGERWSGFMALLQYGTASSWLNLIFLIGLPLLLGYPDRLAQRPTTRSRPSTAFHQTRLDWLLLLFGLAFLLGHGVFSFQVWDRYLLGLIPLSALLLARVLLLPWSIFKAHWPDRYLELKPWVERVAGLSLGVVVVLAMARPVQEAANARYPLGSNSHALRGIEQVTAYLQGNVGADTTLYHRWLGTHWRFYLWGYPYDLQYWPSARFLAARARPGHLIAFPSWESDTEARLALAEAGLELHELMRAYNPAGYPSIILYRIELK